MHATLGAVMHRALFPHKLFDHARRAGRSGQNIAPDPANAVGSSARHGAPGVLLVLLRPACGHGVTRTVTNALRSRASCHAVFCDESQPPCHFPRRGATALFYDVALPAQLGDLALPTLNFKVFGLYSSLAGKGVGWIAPAPQHVFVKVEMSGHLRHAHVEFVNQTTTSTLNLRPNVRLDILHLQFVEHLFSVQNPPAAQLLPDRTG